MPTYEYRCKDCGEDLEVVQSFQDDPLTECPQCQGRLRKVFGSIGISFKGSGFYKNDSRASAGTRSSGNDGSGASSSSDSGSSDGSSTSTSEKSGSSTGSNGGSSNSDSGSSAKSSAGSSSTS